MKESTLLNICMIIIGIGIIFGLGYVVGYTYQNTALSVIEIADNIEYLAFSTDLPSILRHDEISIGRLKELYKDYSGMQSRMLLEHYAGLICYKSLPDKDFKRQSELMNIKINDTQNLWGLS